MSFQIKRRTDSAGTAYSRSQELNSAEHLRQIIFKLKSGLLDKVPGKDGKRERRVGRQQKQRGNGDTRREEDDRLLEGPSVSASVTHQNELVETLGVQENFYEGKSG